MNGPQEELKPPRDAAIRSMLIDEIAAAPAARQKKRRRNILFGIGGAVVVATLAGTGAGVVLHAKAVSNSAIVHCLPTASSSTAGRPDASATLAHPDGAARVDDAIALCTQMWAAGVFEPGYDPDSTSNQPGTVPAKLTLCVEKDGSAAVVPGDGDDLCTAIGLAPLKP